MSKNQKENEGQNAHESENRDIRMPANELSQEEQREKSTRNTEHTYEAENPGDPYADSYGTLTDRAEDDIDAAENDPTDQDISE